METIPTSSLDTAERTEYRGDEDVEVLDYQ
jgi:hypothetical protein